ncbi:CPBP family intramembrane glutamic endopeptidase [Ancylomarina sp. 16SWW S1-10-2]|uniref:CPBP family intramembrane glutamic endopeptidase n=1 Tax=Ancylomarina sp. 16SWW S1-10-2 TaxID=2499681 RepID=UPI0012AD38D8|nr:CPBP family intramembrane glutamic endopeptidase [Ancylomarina sp. 16SWW S1-10-2]MRT93697.1 CPBP family intramembrane metalloprotease [Ancylomarina sp. 16SWW S1-10-2]
MKFLERALRGPNEWWKYVLLPIIAFAIANTIGAIPLGIAMVIGMAKGGEINPNNMADLSGLGFDGNTSLFLMLFPFIIGLIGFILILKPFHKRSIKEVINGTQRIRWSRFFYSAAVWTLISGLILFADYYMNPSHYELNLNWSLFFPLIVISLLMFPFQTSFEEIIFRGYLAQGVARWTRNRWFVVLLPGILFGLMHIMNPEIKEYGFLVMMPQYIIMGLVFGLMAVLDDGIETSMGAHAANNIFIAIFVTAKASALQTPALFVNNHVDPVNDLIIMSFSAVIIIVILARKYNWNFSVLNQRVEGEKIE